MRSIDIAMTGLAIEPVSGPDSFWEATTLVTADGITFGDQPSLVPDRSLNKLGRPRANHKANILVEEWQAKSLTKQLFTDAPVLKRSLDHIHDKR